MSYVACKISKGVKQYLDEKGNWTRDRLQAKEYKGQFWIELLKILVDLVRIFGVSNIKFVKK